MIPRFRPGISFSDIIHCWKPSFSAKVSDFEDEFARLSNAKFAIAFPYGRTALLALLKAFELKSREVLCPAHTCVVVPHAVVLSGNIPVFVDSSSNDFNLCLEKASDLVTPNTSALLATSLYGHPIDLKSLQRFREKHPSILVIHDCAHSFFCTDKGQSVHTDGNAAFFGLGISKIITSIFGGMVTTNSREISDKLRGIRSTLLHSPTKMRDLKMRLYATFSYLAFQPLFYPFIRFLDDHRFLDHFTVSHSESKIDMPGDFCEEIVPSQIAMGIRQVLKYGEIIRERRELATFYFESLKSTPHIELPPNAPGATYSQFVIRTDHRGFLREFLRKKGVELGQIIDYYIPGMEAYRDIHGNRPNCPNAVALASRCANLPVGISLEEAKKVVQALEEACAAINNLETPRP